MHLLDDSGDSNFKLLLDCLPIVARKQDFALKGGAAINLFLRNFPRRTYDIDLTYSPKGEDIPSCEHIGELLKEISDDVKTSITDINISEKINKKYNTIEKLKISSTNNKYKIIIEVNLYARGSIIGNPKPLELQSNVLEYGGSSFKMNVASNVDIYGGKIHAALFRRKASDLYDMHGFFENSSITEDIRKSFAVHLVCQQQTPSIVLTSESVNFENNYKKNLEDLMIECVSVEEIKATEDVLISEVVRKMPENHKEFVVSFFEERPQWSKLDLPGVDTLPPILSKLDKLKSETVKEKQDKLTEINKLFDSL